MKNITTKYLGYNLNSPIVVSSCNLSEKVEDIIAMEDAGAGAVVLFSLFEEQIKQEIETYEAVWAANTKTYGEANSFFPDIEEFHIGTNKYLELIRQVKERVDMPVFASLNGMTAEGWVDYSRQVEAAGADGIEINMFFIPADVHLESREVENRYLQIVRRIKENVSIPVALKLNPYFSALANMAQRLELEGVDGIVMFNRFFQPDFDIQELKVVHNMEYSNSSEIRLPLLWIAALYGRLNVSLAATTGVQSAREIVKFLLAGSDVVMTASSLYKNGIKYITTMNRELEDWMSIHNYDSIDQFRGVMSQQNISDPIAYERANYIRVVGTDPYGRR